MVATSAAAALGGVTGCFVTDSGRPPDLNRIYFPTGIALGPSQTDPSCTPTASAPCEKGPRRLYLANSDFDLQFNAGTLQSYDLDRLRSFVPHYCRSKSDCTDPGKPVCDIVEPGEKRTTAPTHFCVADKGTPCPPELGLMSPADRLLYPGLCGALDPAAPPDGKGSLLVSAVQIGAFVTDVAYKDNPKQPGHGRLFLPVRGDATLHWIDVDDAATGDTALDCGQGSDRSCDGNHRRGGDPTENTRGVQLSPEPFGVAVDERGEAVLTTHQSDGSVGLFVNRWTAEGGKPMGPNLEFVLTLPDLPSGAMAIAPIPEPAIVTRPGMPCLQYQPGFLMTFRNSAEVRLIHYFSDHVDCTNPDGGLYGTDPSRPFLEASRSSPITTNSTGFDSRGIAIDASKRQDCEKKCTGADQVCLNACAPISLDVYVSNRMPATLIFGHTVPNGSATSSDDAPVFWSTLSLHAGASRVFVGNVIDLDGSLKARVFVVCFDAREIWVYDPVAQRVETIINTGRGPHAFALDSENGLGYVGHFTDSYLGVVDLNRGHTETYGKMVLSVGIPVPPRASK